MGRSAASPPMGTGTTGSMPSSTRRRTSLPNPRRLIAYELTDDEYARETERHKRWEEVGGTSYCFHLPVEQRRRPYRSREALQEFYDEENAQPRPDYTSREPQAWFVPAP